MVFINKKLDNQVNTSSNSFINNDPHLNLVVGSIGSGKSTLILNMILSSEIYGEKFNNIYIFNPNGIYDDKWKILLNKKILKVNKKLLLKEIQEQKDYITNKLKREQNTIIRQKLIFTYNKLTTDEKRVNSTDFLMFDKDNFIKTLDINFLVNLRDKQAEIAEKYGKTYLDKILLVFDDCIAYKKKLKDENFMNLIVSLRHLNFTCILSTQAYYEVNKTYRTQSGIKIFFNIFNRKELQNIYFENNADYSFEEFEERFKNNMKIPNSFILLNLYRPYRQKMIFNLNKII